MKMDICCIGHITLDKIVTPGNTIFLPGGTAYYFSHAMASFAVDYLLVTALADTELPFVKELEDRSVRVKTLPSTHTVFFENIYQQNQDRRTQKVRQQAVPFSAEDLADVEASIFHLGPLLAHDMPGEMIETLAAKGKVSLDVQGFLRRLEGEEVIPIGWDAKKELLPAVYYLKASEEELNVLTGTVSLEEGARMVASWGVREVIITCGSKGSVIYTQNNFYNIPAYPPTMIVDATGCGDTYMAGYLYQRVKGNDPQRAGEFAAAMASLKIATAGPFKGTTKEINDILQNNGK